MDSASSDPRPCIMIVDDDPGILAFLQARCEHAGLNPLIFTHLLEAVRHAHDRRPGMIILDVHVGQDNGLSTCEYLAISKRLGCISVIVMTADSDRNVEERANSAGAHFIRKGPDFWTRLEPLISKHFGLREVETL